MSVIRASLSDLTSPRHETDKEYRYNCPWCESVRGKPDRKAKLYVSKTKGVGYCFRCHTKVVTGSVSERLPDAGNARDMSQLRHRLAADVRDENGHVEEVEYNMNGWTSSLAESEVGMQYVLNRGISSDASSRFGVRHVHFPISGVVLPNCVWENKWGWLMTDYYQIRRWGKGAGKYRSPASERPLYYSHLIGSGVGPVVVVEGAFSAISVWDKLRDVRPVALLGSTVTARQVGMLERALRGAGDVPCIHVLLDGGMERAARKVAERITAGIPRCPEMRIASLPEVGRDPNEQTADQIRKALESAKSHQYYV